MSAARGHMLRCVIGCLLGFAILAPAVAAAVSPGCAEALAIAPQARPTVHVLLSPRMPYALQEWARMRGLALTAGFEVAAYRDPRVPQAEWQAAVARAAGADSLGALPPLDLQRARACDLLNHSPTAVVAHCGRVHAWPVRGVMPDEAWRHVLAARLASLQALPCPPAAEIRG